MRMIGPDPEPIVVEEGEVVKFPNLFELPDEEYEREMDGLRELAGRIKQHSNLEGKEFLNWLLKEEG